MRELNNSRSRGEKDTTTNILEHSKILVSLLLNIFLQAGDLSHLCSLCYDFCWPTKLSVFKTS